jgi:hypothetical protein
VTTSTFFSRRCHYDDTDLGGEVGGHVGARRYRDLGVM